MQMLGDLLAIPAVKGFGTSLSASPAPKVFTAHDGFETYSSKFYIHWTDHSGIKHRTPLRHDNYSGIKGPYNRRNAYGAAISYGPVLVSNPLTRPMFEQAALYALCEGDGLMFELGILPVPHTTISVELEPREQNSRDARWKLMFTADCDQRTLL